MSLVDIPIIPHEPTDDINKKPYNITAVFVVQFDIQKGNIIEWQYPPDVNLQGIEYQAVCSGLHKIESDTVYFSRKDCYGICVFQNMPIESGRGALMKGIGVLVQPTSDTSLCGEVWRYAPYLRNELRTHMVLSEEIEETRYTHLINLYTEHKHHEGEYTGPYGFNMSADLTDPNNSVLYNMKHHILRINDPHHDFGTDVFEKFIHIMGPDIFTVWKHAIIRKRIMLLNAPPMEMMSKYVYMIHMLSKVPQEFQTRLPKKKSVLIPKYTVGVNDIPELENNDHSYVACTPDSIFQMKVGLYDLMIVFPQQNKRLQIKTKNLPSKHNTVDFMRFRILWNMIDSNPMSWRKYVLEEPNDIVSVSSASIVGAYYWLYDQKDSSGAMDNWSTWPQLFGGLSGNRSNSSTMFMNRRLAAGLEESAGLLAEAEEQDATEINNSEIFEVVTNRASQDLHNLSVETIQLKAARENKYMNFFHSLSYYVLDTLRTVLSINEEEGTNVIQIYPEDMVKLGLDPFGDIDFVKELAFIYFKKHVQVTCCSLSSLCCCRKRPAVIRLQ
ncbi:hypothetical protein BDB01DRAFT_851416 [Pilobolus umbonatus]|nr:hypothetical protein BDB01DRAFT_851416 [Pilobolus umbonatus]